MKEQEQEIGDVISHRKGKPSHGVTLALVVQSAYESLIIKPGCDVLTIPGEGENIRQMTKLLQRRDFDLLTLRSKKARGYCLV